MKCRKSFYKSGGYGDAEPKPKYSTADPGLWSAGSRGIRQPETGDGPFLL